MRFAPTRAPQRRAAVARVRPLTLVAIAALLLSCDDGATDPTARGNLPIAFSVNLAGGAADAFDAADAIHVTLVSDDVVVHDEVLPFSSGGGDVRIRLPVDRDLEGVRLDVGVELRLGQAPLFRGFGSVVAAAGSGEPVDIVLDPVVSAVLPPADRLIPDIGETLQLAAAAIFATGDTITSASITYQLLGEGVIRLTPGGIAVGESEGVARVRASAGGRSVDFDVEVRSTTPRPAAPTGVTADATGTTVSLTWRDNATNETSYVVERGPVGGPLSTAATLSANSLEFSETLPIDQIVDYVVSACNGQVCSPANRISVRTVPAAPTGLTVLLNSPSGMFRLGWTDASAAETEFHVEALDPAFNQFVLVASVATGTTQYDGSGPPSTTATYRVVACNPAGCSVPTNTVQITFAAAPPTVMTLPSNTGTEMVGSTDATSPTHTWWFEYYDDPSFVDAFVTSPVNTTSGGVWTYPLFDLESGTLLYYRIVAENSAGMTIGATQQLTAPELTQLGPSTATVCNLGSSCMIDPPTITFTAETKVIGTGPSPFQFASFDVESPFSQSLPGTISLSFFDDPDGTRIYTYSLTVDAQAVFSSIGAYSVVVRGYPTSSSGNVVSAAVNFTVTSF